MRLKLGKLMTIHVNKIMTVINIELHELELHVHIKEPCMQSCILTYLVISSLFMSFILVGIIAVAFGNELYGLGS